MNLELDTTSTNNKNNNNNKWALMSWDFEKIKFYTESTIFQRETVAIKEAL